MGTWEKSFCSIFPFSLTVSNENILVESDFLSNVWIEFDVDGKKMQKDNAEAMCLFFPVVSKQEEATEGSLR